MRIAVLAGGRSLERAVSERSGARVELALRRLGHDPVLVDPGPDLARRLLDGGFECAFVALHGRGGEDGVVQEVLELAGLPYTGADPAACARASDKVAAKRALLAAGLPTPPFAALSASAVRDLGADALLGRLAERVGLPLVVKPCVGGSGFGIRRVTAVEELPAALLSALAYDDEVLCEAFVAGREVTVTVLRGRALAAVETIPLGGDGYDFDARYTPGASDFVAPAEVGEAPLRLAEQACVVLGCPGFARVDFLIPPTGEPQLLEVNVVPGLTETSTAPLAAEAVGKPFEDLVADLVADALARP